MVCQLTYNEARRVMGLPPPADDPRLHVLRARAFSGLRWTDKAVDEYAVALEDRPDDRQIMLEHHRSRGYLLVSQRRWNEAAPEFARASELQPDEPYFWWFQAILHLASADRVSYRRVCASMLDRFAATDDPRTAHAVVATGTLLPDALANMGRLVAVGNVAARWYPGSGRMLAAAQCRAGEYEEAVGSFKDAATGIRLRADDLLILALAHHHLGDDVEAHRCYRSAVEWIDEANDQQLSDPAGTRPAWGDWPERIYVPLLRAEVESLLKK
jgi:tetratricopeptide (TPR) repeat protein